MVINRLKRCYQIELDCNTLFRPIAQHGTLNEFLEARTGYVIEYDLYMELRELTAARTDTYGKTLFEWLDKRCTKMVETREKDRRIRRELRAGKFKPMMTRNRVLEQRLREMRDAFATTTEEEPTTTKKSKRSRK